LTIQGFILDASPLPVPPIISLQSNSLAKDEFSVELDRQSREDAEVNGKKTTYPYNGDRWRYPLVLYVDGVLDEGNLGSIARSAYLLGVDAIVTPLRQSAPWGVITLKASAGAAEAIPIFSVAQPAAFLGNSARQGWRIYASDAIPSEALPAKAGPSSSPESPPKDFARGVVYTIARSSKLLPADYCPVQQHPTLLMMGAEGAGLRNSLLNAAHFKVGIRHRRDVDEVGVDSFNVSVAASLLCYEMLQKPQKAKDLLF
jgi:21S rRNA (GM2251-2'-O)-methyltransferase